MSGVVKNVVRNLAEEITAPKQNAKNIMTVE
jgi:hypothetical protein